LSTEFQVFFSRSPSGVRGEYGQPQVAVSELERQVAAARKRAAEELHQQYEAQINDLRAEAVEFHQQFLDQFEQATQRWQRKWEEQVPQLIFAGVRAVLSDFECTDEQLHDWVKGTLDEAGANDKSELEVRLSPRNAERLEKFWKENDITLPGSCRLHPMSDQTDVECRVIGRRGIFDASLTERLAQLKRLWNLAE